MDKQVYVWGRNRQRPPVYHVEGEKGKTACGWEIPDHNAFNRTTMMGWASKREAQEVARPCGLCYR